MEGGARTKGGNQEDSVPESRGWGLNVLKGQDAWKVAPQRSAGQGWQCSQESIGAQVREWAVSVDHTAGHQKRRAEVMRCSAKTSLKGP